MSIINDKTIGNYRNLFCSIFIILFVASVIVAQKPLSEKAKLNCINDFQQLVAESKPINPKSLDKCYGYLLSSSGNNSLANSEYLFLIEKLEKSDTSTNTILLFSTIAKNLVERNLFIEAEKYLRIGLKRIEDEFSLNQKTEKVNKSRLAYIFNLNKAFLLNFLGEILIKQNRIDEEIIALNESLALNKENFDTLNNLGKCFEGKKDYRKAEIYYVDAISNNLDNQPNLDYVKELYQKQNGNLTDYENYLQKTLEIAKTRRQKFIVDNKDVNSIQLPNFSLKTIDDRIFSSTDLKGKVIVINIWATWCGPCLKEMKDFNELAKFYQDNKDVVILTINSGEDAKTIKNFMSKNHYSFDVLLSDNFLKMNEIVGLPTTWFVNKEGNVIYTKINYSQKLFDEFNWRIQELNK